MSLTTRKLLRLGLPLLVAALYLLQTLLTYLDSGEVSTHYLIGVGIFLVIFVAFWFDERSQP